MYFFQPLSRCVEKKKSLYIHFHEAKPCRPTINIDGYITFFSSPFVTIKFRGERRVFYDTHFIMYKKKKNTTQACTHFTVRDGGPILTCHHDRPRKLIRLLVDYPILSRGKIRLILYICALLGPRTIALRVRACKRVKWRVESIRTLDAHVRTWIRGGPEPSRYESKRDCR